MDLIVNKILDKIKKAIYYISLGLVFIVFACMLALPFLVSNTSFDKDDLVIKDKTFKVMEIDGKVNIKVSDDYVNTGISYDKYSTYIKNFNKKGNVKKTMVIELFLLFILFETLCIHYLISNFIQIFVDKEPDEYKQYLIRKSFLINAISIYGLDFIRRFIFRNTIFSSLSASLAFFYVLTIILFFAVYKIVGKTKASMLKEKKSYEKVKESN